MNYRESLLLLDDEAFIAAVEKILAEPPMRWCECGADISHRGFHAKFCVDCAKERKRAAWREWYRETGYQGKPRPREAA